ncbi:MAG TPA: M28 family peptidase [Gaiellaceae bacterium]|nr:M28 family peptidase [Gaiellaceae bacterium]
MRFSPEYLQHVVERLASIGSHPLGFRVAGTPEEREAVDFVAGEMRSLGLEKVVEEPVPVDGWRLEEAYVELADGTRVEGASFGGVPETGAKGVEGELVRVGRGGRRQLDRLDVEGKIALVEWQVARLWPYHVGLELGLRGAKAMVLYVPEGGPFYQAPGAIGTFDGIWHAEGPPCVTIRREDAPRLEGRVRVVLRAPRRPSTGWNVVGELRGRRRGAPAIVAGHHDGWFEAAFDDATGVAVTLELARAFTDAGVRPERTIAFVSHTAEEYGIAESAYDWCYGAWYQVVAEHREWSTRSPFYLNVEGSGRPDVFTLDVPPELTRWIRRHCRTADRDGLLPHGWKLARPNTWTEVWPFLAAGIPAINVSTFTDEFDRTEYHTQYDTADKVDFGYLAKLTEVCARLLLDEPDLRLEARARELAKLGIRPGDLTGDRRKRFTAFARGLHGLDAIDAPRYPHEQTEADVANLERALEDPDNAAGHLARVGINWLCPDLSHEAFRIELGRRGRRARRACWGAMGDADPGPDLWRELASLRGEPGARKPGPWLERSLHRHLERSRRELERRRARMAAAADGRVLPLPRARDLPGESRR